MNMLTFSDIAKTPKNTRPPPGDLLFKLDNFANPAREQDQDSPDYGAPVQSAFGIDGEMTKGMVIFSDCRPFDNSEFGNKWIAIGPNQDGQGLIHGESGYWEGQWLKRGESPLPILRVSRAAIVSFAKVETPGDDYEGLATECMDIAVRATLGALSRHQEALVAARIGNPYWRDIKDFASSLFIQRAGSGSRKPTSPEFMTVEPGGEYERTEPIALTAQGS